MCYFYFLGQIDTAETYGQLLHCISLIVEFLLIQIIIVFFFKWCSFRLEIREQKLAVIIACTHMNKLPI